MFMTSASASMPHHSLLQVAVGDVPIWIVSGDDVSLDVRREGHAPQEGLLALGKEDPTHARLGSVNAPNCQRVVRHELSKAGGVSCDALSKQFKVCQVIV